jgi:hypothetical protein
MLGRFSRKCGDSFSIWKAQDELDAQGGVFVDGEFV